MNPCLLQLKKDLQTILLSSLQLSGFLFWGSSSSLFAFLHTIVEYDQILARLVLGLEAP